MLWHIDLKLASEIKIKDKMEIKICKRDIFIWFVDVTT